MRVSTKPKFDPSKPFEVVGASEKPRFDPSKPFETVEENYLSLEEPSLMSKIGEGIVSAGKAVDSYTGAPARASIGAIQDGENPLLAFTKQFGENPDLAPTGKDIAAKSGLSTESPLINTARQRAEFDKLHNPGQYAAIMKSGGYEDQQGFSPAGAVGLGIDIAADPTNLLPALPLAKGALKIGSKALGGAARIGASAAGALAKTTEAGTKAVQGAQKMQTIVADSAKATKEALAGIFKPTQAADWQRWSGIAEKNGIDPNLLPESVEFGPGSVISRTARTVREGPVGQEAMDRFQEGIAQLDNAMDTRIAKISGGIPVNEVEAGDLIRAAHDDAVERLFNDVDFTYDSVIQQSPGIALLPESMAKLESKLNGVEKWARGRVMRGITRSDKEQGAQLLRAIEGIRAGNGSLKQVSEAMSDIGKHAFKARSSKQALNDTPVDIEKFRDLYFTMRDEFLNSTAAQLGPDIANRLVDSNQQISSFLKNKEPIAVLLNNKQLAPEKLFKSLIVGGDTNKIAALKEMLTPEQFNQLKGSYLESLIKRNPDETINFGALRALLQKNRTTLSVLFEPQEIADVVELAQLGERFGPAVLSTSGTGGSNIFRNFYEGLQSGATNRTTLEAMKESARGRGARVVEEAAPAVSASPLLKGGRPPLPRRTTPDEIAKYLQILATQGGSEESKDSVSRRLEAIKRLRGATQ